VDPFGLWSLWNTYNWIWHYFHGSGKPIDLADIGLLGAWRSATAADVDALRAELASDVSNSTACSGEGVFQKVLPTKTGSRVFNGAMRLNPLNVLFAIGQSTVFYEADLKVTWTCECCSNGGLRRTSLSWVGRVQLHMRDHFQDPIPRGDYDDPVGVGLANCLADCWRDYPHDSGARLACIGACRLNNGWPVTDLANPYQINADTVEPVCGVRTSPCP